MIKALAPGLRRGCSWVWISIALAGGLAPAVLAQSPKSKSSSAVKKGETSKDEAKKDADADNAPAPAEPAEEPKVSTVETFVDPNAEAAIKVIKSVSGINREFKESDVKRILAQAGGEPIDRDLLQKFVNGMAYALIDKTNINALINPPPGINPRGDAARAVQRASDHLLDVYHTARRAKNTSFIASYNDVLVETLPKLLDNNLISRIQAMIVLGQTGSPRAVPIFLKQLEDPKQTVWVKYWAARGLSNLVENGVKIDSYNIANESASKIEKLLQGDKNLPWPVQFRLLEALGSMRVASKPNNPQADMAMAAVPFLADPEAHPEVRAEAAWALGMMRVSPATRDYNYPMIAYYSGQIVADIGEDIGLAISENRTLAEYLTSLLIGPMHQAFHGLDGANDSGLLKIPGGNASLPYIRQVSDLSAAVTRASVELVKAPNGQIPKYKKSLDGQVEQLKAFLDKNPPKSFRLVPNTKEYAPAQPQVAEAPPGDQGVAGVPGR